MTPLSPGSMFLFDPYSRPDAAERIYVHYIRDADNGMSDTWYLDPGETFLLVEEPRFLHNATHFKLMEWQVLSRGMTGSIIMSEKQRRALRLVSPATEG